MSTQLPSITLNITAQDVSTYLPNPLGLLETIAAPLQCELHRTLNAKGKAEYTATSPIIFNDFNWVKETATKLARTKKPAFEYSKLLASDAKKVIEAELLFRQEFEAGVEALQTCIQTTLNEFTKERDAKLQEWSDLANLDPLTYTSKEWQGILTTLHANPPILTWFSGTLNYATKASKQYKETVIAVTNHGNTASIHERAKLLERKEEHLRYTSTIRSNADVILLNPTKFTSAEVIAHINELQSNPITEDRFILPEENSIFQDSKFIHTCTIDLLNNCLNQIKEREADLQTNKALHVKLDNLLNLPTLALTWNIPYLQETITKLESWVYTVEGYGVLYPKFVEAQASVLVELKGILSQAVAVQSKPVNEVQALVETPITPPEYSTITSVTPSLSTSHNNIVIDLQANGCSEYLANTLLTALLNNQIRHVKVIV